MRRSPSAMALVRRVLIAVVVTSLAASWATVAVAAAAPAEAPAATPAQKATGDPVKVGLITTGGDCDGCSGQARGAGCRGRRQVAERDAERARRPPDGAGDVRRQQRSRQGGRLREPDDQRRASSRSSRGPPGPSGRRGRSCTTPASRSSTTRRRTTRSSRTTESTFILYDPLAQTVTLPIEVAKAKKAKKISVIVGRRAGRDRHLRQSRRTASRRPGIEARRRARRRWGPPTCPTQAQQIVTDNPDGVVSIVGHDAFCIPALNALQRGRLRGHAHHDLVLHHRRDARGGSGRGHRGHAVRVRGTGRRQEADTSMRAVPAQCSRSTRPKRSIPKT